MSRRPDPTGMKLSRRVPGAPSRQRLGWKARTHSGDQKSNSSRDSVTHFRRLQKITAPERTMEVELTDETEPLFHHVPGLSGMCPRTSPSGPLRPEKIDTNAPFVRFAKLTF